MNLDMTKGSPLKLILKFLVPVLLGCLFQQLYNMVDTIIVGKGVGSDCTCLFLVYRYWEFELLLEFSLEDYLRVICSAAGVIYFLSAAISCIISLMYIDIHCITLLYQILYINVLFFYSAVLFT